MVTKQITPTQQWMLDHPDDTPCPAKGGGSAARAWRIKRGLQQDPNEWKREHGYMRGWLPGGVRKPKGQ